MFKADRPHWANLCPASLCADRIEDDDLAASDRGGLSLAPAAAPIGLGDAAPHGHILATTTSEIIKPKRANRPRSSPHFRDFRRTQLIRLLWSDALGLADLPKNRDPPDQALAQERFGKANLQKRYR